MSIVLLILFNVYLLIVLMLCTGLLKIYSYENILSYFSIK